MKAMADTILFFLETAYDALLGRYIEEADKEDGNGAQEFSEGLLEMDPRTLASLLVVGFMKNAILLHDIAAANERLKAAGLEPVKPGDDA